MSLPLLCPTVWYLLAEACFQESGKSRELLIGCRRWERREEERREPGCVRGGCHMDDDVAGSPVLLPHLEGTEQFCCLPFMEGDIGSGS